MYAERVAQIYQPGDLVCLFFECSSERIRLILVRFIDLGARLPFVACTGVSAPDASQRRADRFVSAQSLPQQRIFPVSSEYVSVCFCVVEIPSGLSKRYIGREVLLDGMLGANLVRRFLEQPHRTIAYNSCSRPASRLTRTGDTSCRPVYV
jgi:hypothetical protein